MTKVTHTASFAALTGRALTIFRAGLALNIIGSPLNGFVTSSVLFAGFLMTTNFANQGTRNTPVFLSSLYPTVASVSKTPFTSFFATSFSAAIFSISCDLVILAAISRSFSLIRCDGQYLEKASKTYVGDDLHSFCSHWSILLTFRNLMDRA